MHQHLHHLSQQRLPQCRLDLSPGSSPGPGPGSGPGLSSGLGPGSGSGLGLGPGSGLQQIAPRLQTGMQVMAPAQLMDLKDGTMIGAGSIILEAVTQMKSAQNVVLAQQTPTQPPLLQRHAWHSQLGM